MNNYLTCRKISILLVFISLTVVSCKKSVKFCVDFDQTGYTVSDTIKANATCSSNVDTYSWSPGNGLTMIGDGTNASEQFIVLPLTGITFRTISLGISNSKSSLDKTESVIVL